MRTNMLFFQPIRNKPKSPDRGLNLAPIPALGVFCMFFASSSDWFIVFAVYFDWSSLITLVLLFETALKIERDVKKLA